jgi:hypothetical protein
LLADATGGQTQGSEGGGSAVSEVLRERVRAMLDAKLEV